MTNESDNEYKYGLDYQPGLPGAPDPFANKSDAPAGPVPAAPAAPAPTAVPTAAKVEAKATPPKPKTEKANFPAKARESSFQTNQAAPKSTDTTRGDTKKPKSSPPKKQQRGSVSLPLALFLHVCMIGTIGVSFSIANSVYFDFIKTELHRYDINKFFTTQFQSKVDQDESKPLNKIPQKFLYARHLNSLGDCYLNLHEDKLAEQAIEKSFKIKLELKNVAHTSMVSSFKKLASLYERAGDVVRAEFLYRELLRDAEEKRQQHLPKGRVNIGLGNLILDLTNVLLQSDQIEEAEKVAQSGQKYIDIDQMTAMPILKAQFEVYLLKKEFDKAESVLNQAEKFFKIQIGEIGNDPQFDDASARLENARGNSKKALQLLRKEMAKLSVIFPEDSANYADACLRQSRILVDAGELKEAEQLLKSSLERLDSSSLCRPAVIRGWIRYKEVLEKNGKNDLALKAEEKIKALQEARSERDRIDREKLEELKVQVNAILHPTEESTVKQNKTTDAADTEAPYLLPLVGLFLLYGILSWKVFGNMAGYAGSLTGRNQAHMFWLGLILGPLGTLTALCFPAKDVPAQNQKQKLANACVGWVIFMTFLDWVFAAGFAYLGTAQGVLMREAIPPLMAVPIFAILGSIVLTLFSASLLSIGAMLISVPLSTVCSLFVPGFVLNEAGRKKKENGETILPLAGLNALNTALWRFAVTITMVTLFILSMLYSIEF